MARSIAGNPWRLGALLGILIAIMAAMLVLQLTYAGSSDTSAGGTIVEQGVAIATDTGAGGTPSPGNAVLSGTGGPAPLASFPEDLGEAGPADFSTYASGNGRPVPQPGGPGTLAGTLRASGYASGGPAPRMTVFLADSDGTFTGITALTGVDGSFRFTEMDPGDYRIFFFDANNVWQAAWYGEPSTAGGATVRVAAAGVTEITQAILPAEPTRGAISGRVVDAADAGVSGVTVLVYSVEAGGGALVLSGETVTDSDGRYSMTGLLPTSSEGAPGLPAGYKVLFLPGGDAFASQWFEGQPTHDTAKLIAIKPGETVGGIDAGLGGGGTIGGRVSIEGGQPAVYAMVDFYDESGVIVDTQLTAGDGSYESDTLPVGAYRLKVTPRSRLHVAEWYNDRYDFAAADRVYVLSGMESGGINVSLGLEPAGNLTNGDSLNTEPPLPPSDKGGSIPEDGPTPAAQETSQAGPASGNQPEESDARPAAGVPQGVITVPDEQQDEVGGQGSENQLTAAQL